MNTKSSKSFFSLYLLIGLILLGTWTQSHFVAYEKKTPLQTSEFDYLPSSNYVRFISLGENTSIAHILWVRAMIYFGGNMLSGKENTWFMQLADLVSTLDPEFISVYRFVGSVVKADSAGKGLAIMEKGLPYYQKDWKTSLYYSLLVLDQKEDYKKAAQIMAPFKNDPKAPEYIRGLSQTYETQSRPLPLALGVFLEDYAKQDKALRIAVSNKILRTINHYRPKDNLVKIEFLRPLLDDMVAGKKDPALVHQILVQLGSVH